jgi:hypothetical protein
LRQGPGGKLLIGGARFQGTMVVDPETGETVDWKPELAGCDGDTAFDANERGDFRPSPDGQRLVFPAKARDQQAQKAPAVLIWTCKPDGSDAKPLTPWEDAVVPMAKR